ncbi:acyl carrier protein [Carboxylicivirga caseinilyticus]|uniref:acyl carrier protein n=1 Tax=Carboxylicivirga caseinilyticus TaxID=3417572 RepID=UPI002AA9173D|nr:acyl carrier protein [uncultured Carboxylicivirga sp.]MCU4165006.1 acyl carrier protein [Marinilabiliaceae bacterium A049]
MKDKIKEFIAETTFTDVNSFNDDTMIFDEGIFDSMGLLGLINFLESEFGIVTDDTELQEENFGSVERIADFVGRKMSLAS